MGVIIVKVGFDVFPRNVLPGQSGIKNSPYLLSKFSAFVGFATLDQET